MTATYCSPRSKDVCQICGQEASYRCLHCAKPVCNRSKSGSPAASGEETGWKSGHVSISTPCKSSKLKPCVEEHSATPQGGNTTRAKARQTCTELPKHEVKVQVCKAKLLPWIKEISWSFWNRQDADSNNTEKTRRRLQMGVPAMKPQITQNIHPSTQMSSTLCWTGIQCGEILSSWSPVVCSKKRQS